MKYENEGIWKTTGRPRELSVAAVKLMRCLQIMNLLENGRYSINEISKRFEISTRTVYRYIHLFDEIGLIIEKDFENRFFIIKII